MSTATSTIAEAEAQHTSQVGSAPIVLCLGPSFENASTDQLAPLLALLRDALGEMAADAVVAYPVSDPQAASWQHDGMALQPFLPSAHLQTISVQTATSYIGLHEVMRAHESICGILLGAEAQTLAPHTVRLMVEAVLDHNADLALPNYALHPNEALLNAALLAPLSRAIFGVRAHFPLALDLALSMRMAERMAVAAQKFTAAGQPEAIQWPAAEAAAAGYTVAEVEAGPRELPPPSDVDLATVLNSVATSLFADIEAKASYWQRTRPAATLLHMGDAAQAPSDNDPVAQDEIDGLIESFRLGYTNLHEIWALVLPPHTLLGLKRLSAAPAETFRMTDALWVRIVFDFVLAHRLRTINRGHLLGALTPLYLAWVATHLLQMQIAPLVDTIDPLARAFEADKPYLVSRWRWPDRFNP